MRRGLAFVFWSCAMAALSGCSSHVNAPTDVAGFGPGGQGSAGENSAGETSAGAGRGGDVSGGGSSGTTAGTGPGGGQQPGGGATGSAGHAGASGSTAGSAGGGSGPVGPRFIGRFDTSTPASPTFAWSGTAVALRFKGTAIGVTLTDGGNNWFEVVVDDQHTVLSLQQGTKKYALASNLRDGPHDVLLYRRTEPSFGPTTFSGFDVPSSAYLPGQAVPTHRLEVIGDSISAGYGNEGVLPCTFEGKTENHYLTYEALAARAVGAELYTEAWSGIGMLRNYDGATTGIMPERYPRTLPEQTASTWDFSGYTPDVVVINLGTNDFAKGDPALAFQTAYTKFVSDLRGHYPKARFYLAIGPMLSEANAAQMKVYLNGVISARAAQSDSNLFLLEFAIQDGTNDGFGCDYHPTLKTHQKMADKLIATLKADLGW